MVQTYNPMVGYMLTAVFQEADEKLQSRRTVRSACLSFLVWLGPRLQHDDPRCPRPAMPRDRLTFKFAQRYTLQNVADSISAHSSTWSGLVDGPCHQQQSLARLPRATTLR